MRLKTKNPMRSGGGISRRNFIRSVGIGAGVMVVPSYVLGGSGQKPPSEKLNIAGVGIGSQGGDDVDEMAGENIVALCDVDWDAAAHMFKKYPNARRYKDFRVMLDKEKNIDAVTVGTPDHNHAIVSMTAIKHGKHVYCEKPLTHNISETRALVQAAREAKVITQMGIQGHGTESVRRFCEYIWAGAIGTVKEVHMWSPGGGRSRTTERPKETPPIPKTLDWDVWLGPAPERPYNPVYLHGAWRSWLDFGTGTLGDMGCHIFDSLCWALKLGPPISVEASNAAYRGRSKETWPHGSIVRYQFPARDTLPPLKVTWYDGGLMPEIPEELADETDPTKIGGDEWGGLVVVGDKGTIIAGSTGAEGLQLLPESLAKDYPHPPKTIKRSIGHYKEWVASCKSGEPAGANFDYSGPLTETVLLGDIAVRTGRKLLWDAPNMKITNFPEANAWLQREYRKGWAL